MNATGTFNVYGNHGGHGNNDNNGYPNDAMGGGGGGAGSAGIDGDVGSNPGNGGDGIEINITGTNVWYAGGGGGAGDSSVGIGGSGIGGSGGGDRYEPNIMPEDGAPHTGSGGGGVGWSAVQAPYDYTGKGGSGIVIIRYKTRNSRIFPSNYLISDLRIYSNSLLNKNISNIPKEKYFRIGANNYDSISNSILSHLTINNSNSTYTTNLINYHTITETVTETIEIGINKIEGNKSQDAYQWNNLDKNYFMNINNSDKLFNKFYNGFEISITYWTYIINSSNIFNQNTNEYNIHNYDIHMYNTNKTILEVYQTNSNLIQATFNILENDFKLIATTEKELENNKWYLVSISGGIKNDYVSLSIGVYDNTFDGRQISYISASSIIPVLDYYDYSLNNQTVNLDININKFADVNVYNKLINILDIYDILNLQLPKINENKKLEFTNLSDNNEEISLINNNIKDIKYFESNIQSNINISDYYKIELSCSYTKKDLNISENISDLHIYTSNIDNTTSNLIKFGTSNLVIENTIINLNFEIQNNIWYDYYFTLKYENNNTSIDIYQSSNLEIINHCNLDIDNYILFDNKQLPTDIRIGVAYDENPLSINKIIENLKFYTKKIIKQ